MGVVSVRAYLLYARKARVKSGVDLLSGSQGCTFRADWKLLHGDQGSPWC